MEPYPKISQTDWKRMRLKVTNPGVSVDDIKANTGPELIIPDKVETNVPPSNEELHLLREKIDLEKLYIWQPIAMTVQAAPPFL